MVSYRLHPNQIAIGFRLLARNLAIGWQIEQAQARPTVIEDLRALRAHHGDSLGLCERRQDMLVLHAQAASASDCCLLWTGFVIQYVA